MYSIEIKVNQRFWFLFNYETSPCSLYHSCIYIYVYIVCDLVEGIGRLYSDVQPNRPDPKNPKSAFVCRGSILSLLHLKYSGLDSGSMEFIRQVS